ncbi:MAG TPA: sugar phosphate nucleotidyltransferase [Acidobacteriota bacterium]|nr:sugar phosphate nucleotidyltransferase [Acidobacteriota bacterium]
MEPNLIILAGGASSRMKPPAAVVADKSATREAQAPTKTMLPVGPGGRPFLDFLLGNAAEAGYRNILIVVAGMDHSIRDHCGSFGGAKPFSSLNFSFVEQQVPAGRLKPLGTADALLQALAATPDWRGQRFTVCNSDNLYSAPALRLLLQDTHENATIGYDQSKLGYPLERLLQFAVILKDHAGFLRDILEKPSPEEAKQAAAGAAHVEISMNLWRFSYDRILPYLERTPLHALRKEKELPVTVKMMAAELPHSIFVIPRAEQVIDLTGPDDIPVVREYLSRKFPDL